MLFVDRVEDEDLAEPWCETKVGAQSPPPMPPNHSRVLGRSCAGSETQDLDILTDSMRAMSADLHDHLECVGEHPPETVGDDHPCCHTATYPTTQLGLKTVEERLEGRARGLSWMTHCLLSFRRGSSPSQQAP